MVLGVLFAGKPVAGWGNISPDPAAGQKVGLGDGGGGAARRTGCWPEVLISGLYGSQPESVYPHEAGSLYEYSTPASVPRRP
jgi:hypothetical protein